MGQEVLKAYVNDAAARAVAYFSALGPELHMAFGADSFSSPEIVEQINQRTDVGLYFIAMNEWEYQTEAESAKERSVGTFLLSLARLCKESIAEAVSKLKL